MALFLLSAGVLLAGLVATGMVWQHRAQKRDLQRLPPPGTTLEGSGLHVHCSGSGTPVILEAGVAASSIGWTLVQHGLASFCRACAYDRPGYGWSVWSRNPRTPARLVEELRAVVHTYGTPAVLVGHSFGGLLVRLYAASYPNDVLGLVLVDPALVLEWGNPTAEALRKLRRARFLSREGALLARIGFVRLALRLLTGGAHGASKAFATAASSGRGRAYLEALVGQVRKLPPELWPVVQSHWCRPASFTSMAEHLAALPVLAAEVARCQVPRNIPVTVISGEHLTPELMREHQEIAHSSQNGRHIIAHGSAHWVHLDRPDLVVRAVQDILTNTVIT